MIADRRRWAALYVLCTGMLMIVLDTSVVNVALPSIKSDLGFSDANLAWVVNAYLISFAGLLLLAGRFGDLYGRRRMFLAGLVLFTAASVACGAARTESVLIGARFVQGVGGALASAVILGIIVTTFTEPGEQARAIGVFAFVASAGAALGLILGGVLTQIADWHWIFFVNVPIGIATFMLARRLVAPDAPATGGRTDVLGAILCTSALMSAVYTIVQPAARDGWTAAPTLLFAGVTVVLAAAFLLRQACAAEPLVPLSAVRSRNLIGANLIQLIGAAGMFGIFFLGSLYLQRVLGYEPLQIGLGFLPVCVLMGLLSVRYCEPLVTRFGARRAVVTGLLLIAAGLALLGRVPVDASYPVHLLPAMVILGVGAGVAFPALMALAMSAADGADAGLASGVVNTTGQVGGALGLAVLATLAAARTATLGAHERSAAAALVGGYHLAFWVAAGLLVVAVAVGLLVLERPDPSAAEAPVALEPAVQSLPDSPSMIA